MKDKIRINERIQAREVRLIGPSGENFGIVSTAEAIQKAKDAELDLIEISPNAEPPIAKIADYGKFLYEQNKKHKESKGRVKLAEIKSLQIKIGTGEHDLELKAKKASEWLSNGDRVKIDLFLPGRSKYMDQKFLKERLERMLRLIPVEYKIAEDIKKSPKGLSLLIEKAKK